VQKNPGDAIKKKLLAYNFTSSLSGNLVSPFLSLFIYELAGGSFLATSIGSQLPAAISAVMSFIWARLSDSTGKRKSFILMASLTGIVSSVALSFATNLQQVVIIQSLGAITGSAGGSAFSALLAEKFRNGRGEFLGKYNAMGVAGGFIGGLASGELYTLLGYRNLLRLYAALNIIPVALILSIDEEKTTNAKPHARVILHIPRVPRRFWRLYASRLLLTLPGAISGGVLGIYFLRYLRGSPEAWSTTVAITVLAGLSTIPYGKLADKLSTSEMFTMAGLGWTILYAGYYLAPNPLVFAFFFIIPVWPLFWIAYTKALMDISDETERATFYAFEGVLSTIYGSVIGILAGYLADATSPRTLFLLSSLSALSAAILVQKLLLPFSGQKRAKSNPLQWLIGSSILQPILKR
jgi:DHA1 family multidrug resistance protein-like MFS transporter